MLGLDSKLFDYQSVVLLAFNYFDTTDRKGAGALHGGFRAHPRAPSGQPAPAALRERGPRPELILQRQFAQAVAGVRGMAAEATAPDFDFEAACNLVGLLAVLTRTSIDLPDAWMDRIAGHALPNTRSLCELLARAAASAWNNAEAPAGRSPRVNRAGGKKRRPQPGGDPASAVDQLPRACGRAR